ncbi:facilitated trehalose transporter Tret1-like [Macrobrachium rosenbergii]|uniref:facilitated trehalose transporter Tret1-like n=1 Tax=Macrobrachium rosenbergii TaxID=79674 RepID=UPI0034D46CE7
MELISYINKMDMTDENDTKIKPHSLENHIKVETNERKESPSERRIRYAKQLTKVFAAVVGHLSLGMALGWPNVLASGLQTSNSTLFGTQIHFEDWEVDMAGGMLFFATLPGFVCSGWIVARIGRRKSMMLVAVPGVVGWALVLLAINPPMVLVGRFVGGLCYALLGASVRTYLAEISDTSIRGAVSLTTEVMKSIGVITVIGLGMILTWYYVAAMILGHLLFYGACVVPFLPESPTYLVVCNREEEARQLLRRLRGPNVDLDEEIRHLREMNTNRASSNECSGVFTRDVLKRCMVIFGLFLISNFCSTEVIKANAMRMLQTSGLALDKDVSTILVFVLLLTGNVMQALILDKIGRRKCIVVSLILIMLSYVILGAYTFLSSSDIDIVPLETERNITTLQADESSFAGISWSWLPTVCLMTAAFAISLGIGPIPWLLSVEYFPTNIRSQVMGLCNAVGNLFSFASLQIYSPMQTLLTPAGLYWSYASFATIGIVYTFFIVTETKGKNIG